MLATKQANLLRIFVICSGVFYDMPTKGTTCSKEYIYICITPILLAIVLGYQEIEFGDKKWACQMEPSEWDSYVILIYLLLKKTQRLYETFGCDNNNAAISTLPLSLTNLIG